MPLSRYLWLKDFKAGTIRSRGVMVWFNMGGGYPHRKTTAQQHEVDNTDLVVEPQYCLMTCNRVMGCHC